jgi:hypothetical protein
MYSAMSNANNWRSVECLRRRGALLAPTERVVLERGVQVNRSLVDVDLREHDRHAVELLQAQHELHHVLELLVSALQVERPDALEQRVVEARQRPLRFVPHEEVAHEYHLDARTKSGE